MREIKFRAWDESLGKMVFGPSLDTNPDGAIYSCNYDKNGNLVNRPIMQFTGLLDSEGNDIYEGDYVTDDDCILGIVHYVTNSNSIYAGQYILTDGFGFAIDNPELEDCDRWGRVRGNIHQNPELLDNAE